MTKPKINSILSVVIFSCFFCFLSLSQAEVNYYHAQYIKAYCEYDPQTSQVVLKSHEDQESPVVRDILKDMQYCKQVLGQLEKDYCATTTACPIVKTPINKFL